MGAPEHITDADVTEALTALPDITAAEVAGALGIGRSTAAKRLARLETAGVVRRAPGGRSGGAKVADRWSLARPTAETDPAADTATGVSAPTAPDAPAAPGATAAADAAPEPEDARAATADATADEGGSKGAAGPEPRLGPGTLRTLVREYLAARPGQSFGPSGIAKALGRSAGAVSNALSTMAESGEVDLVAERPRRYRIASSH